MMDDLKMTPEQKEMAVYERAVELFGFDNQVVKAMEELAELIQALGKWVLHTNSGIGDIEVILDSIDEERADVAIMLSQLDVIFGDNSAVECERIAHLDAFVEECRENRDWNAGRV